MHGPGLRSELHDLDEPARLARRDDQLQVAVTVGEQDSGRRRAQEVTARVDERLKEFHDVVIVDKGVRKHGECLQQARVTRGLGHDTTCIPPLSRWKASCPSTIDAATSIMG